ncbi:hypothetical protein [Methylibium sp.]|uniref:hypothetical protein n=1 Tax=Methylibium sp. TaxID=2067992 RepID=UPI003D13830D
MFCSNCGTKATGNFCFSCGSRLSSQSSPAEPQKSDWSQEIRYEALLRMPEVRERVSRHAVMAKKAMSAEDFLSISDKILPLFVNIGPLSFQKIGAAVLPVFSQLGISTGKEHSATLSNPPGTTIVAALCSLARHGQGLRAVQQFEDGCLLDAALPSDMWSWEGTLYVSIRRHERATCVDAATKIKGQKFDWGKSKRALEALFQDLTSTPV